MLASKPLTPRSQYIAMSIGVGIGVYLFFGLLSWVVFLIAKKRKNKDPQLLALIVFTVLLSLGVEGNIGKYNSAIKKRNRYEFKDSFKEGLYAGFENGMKQHPEIPDSIRIHSNEICDCIYEKIEFDNEIIDKLMTVDDPKEWTSTSPEMKQIVTDCMLPYLEK